ncbi:MAG: FkbM family methyltransferase [Planctomycetota bacterium]|nr:FkbM family methyltransferase [Planctomycetota bacterium]
MTTNEHSNLRSDEQCDEGLGFLNEFRQKLRIRFHRKFKNAVRALDPLLPRGGVVIDVGAHEGRFGLEVARRPLSNIVLCEAFSRNAKVARWTMAQHANATIVHRAVSDSCGTASFEIPIAANGRPFTLIGFIGRQDTSMNYGRIAQCRTITLEKSTLDRIVEEQNLSRVDFIKIDVEGHEHAVLRGAAQTIARWHPTICIELSTGMAQRSGSTPQEVLDLLLNAGYAFVSIDMKSGVVHRVSPLEIVKTVANPLSTIDVIAALPSVLETSHFASR